MIHTYLNIFEENFLSLFFIFGRVAACISVLPGIGQRNFSMRLKLVLSCLSSIFLFNVLPHDDSNAVFQLSNFFNRLFFESVVGLLYGLQVRILFFSIQAAGTIAAQSTSLSQLLGQSGSEPLPAISHILSISALGFLMISGFGAKLMYYISSSYDLVPTATLNDVMIFLKIYPEWISSFFSMSFSLAAPFLLTSLLYNCSLGIINRAMPQLMVAFVGAPLITLASVGLIFATAPIILKYWISFVDYLLLGAY